MNWWVYLTKWKVQNSVAKHKHNFIGKCKWRKNRELCDRVWVSPLYIFNFLKNKEIENYRKMTNGNDRVQTSSKYWKWN